LESDIDTPSVALENLPLTDMLENIKDDKLVKKIKEEQLIRKMKDEINSPIETNKLGVENIQNLQNGSEHITQEQGKSIWHSWGTGRELQILMDSTYFTKIIKYYFNLLC